MAPGARLIVLAVDLGPAEKRRLLRDLAIADHLLWRDLRSCELVRAVLELIIVHGLVVTSPASVAADAEEPPPDRRHLGDRYGLTDREYEMWQLLAKGFSYRQIADALRIATTTVVSHASTLLGKLNAPSRGDAARVFWEHHEVLPVASVQATTTTASDRYHWGG